MGARGIKGEIHINDEYKEGLKDFEGSSTLFLFIICIFRKDDLLEVKPFLDTEKRGIFATRAPKRPNPIGMSVVRLEKINDDVVYISDIDVVDGLLYWI